MGLRKLINKVINMKKTILLIFIAIVIALIITAIAIYTYIDNTLGVSKDFAVEIKQNDIADHQYLLSGNFIVWGAEERDKMIQYMKENNLRILPGVYQMNQATTFKEALGIFSFEKID